MLDLLKKLIQKTYVDHSEKNVVEAYDIWSDSYDFQPGNLMLDLDDQIFAELLENVDLRDRVVADIGCGTGRHWPRLFEKNPAQILGFDVSSKMLQKLQDKYPDAITHRITDDDLSVLGDSVVDFLLTTLTIAHIKNPQKAIESWSRVLKKGGWMIITDFHPVMLENGGRRSFMHNGRSLSVPNHVHPLPFLQEMLKQNGMLLIQQKEKWLDESVKHYYLSKNALPVYNRFKGKPIIYGFLLNKQCAAK
jgi:ubiquinone/menaquinone biosynthesis C-methylase UbiE